MKSTINTLYELDKNNSIFVNKITDRFLTKNKDYFKFVLASYKKITNAKSGNKKFKRKFTHRRKLRVRKKYKYLFVKNRRLYDFIRQKMTNKSNKTLISNQTNKNDHRRLKLRLLLEVSRRDNLKKTFKLSNVLKQSTLPTRNNDKNITVGQVENLEKTAEIIALLKNDNSVKGVISEKSAILEKNKFSKFAMLLTKYVDFRPKMLFFISMITDSTRNLSNMLIVDYFIAWHKLKIDNYLNRTVIKTVLQKRIKALNTVLKKTNLSAKIRAKLVKTRQYFLKLIKSYRKFKTKTYLHTTKNNYYTTYKKRLRGFFSRKKKRTLKNHNQFIDGLAAEKRQKLVRKLKRYPLYLYEFFLKYKHAFILPPSSKKFRLLKGIILGFNWILRNSLKVKFFFLTLFRQLLVSLFSLPLHVPRFFIVRILNLLLIKEFSYRHLNTHYFSKIMNSRYLIFQGAHAAIKGSINAFDKFKKIRCNFFGMHTKNITSSLIANYICHKLGQYFSIQQILGPVLRDLTRSPILQGFKIVVAGRLTRKERAAFMVRKNGRVSLSQKSAFIDYASQFKIMRFGLVGVKVWLMRKNSFYKPFLYRFSIILLPLLLSFVLLSQINVNKTKIVSCKNPVYIQTRGMKHIKDKLPKNPPKSKLVLENISPETKKTLTVSTNAFMEMDPTLKKALVLPSEAKKIFFKNQIVEHYKHVLAGLQTQKNYPGKDAEITILHCYSKTPISHNIQVWQTIMARLHKEGKIEREIDFSACVDDIHKFQNELMSVLVSTPNLIDEIMSLRDVSLAFPGVLMNSEKSQPLLEYLKTKYPFENFTNNKNPDAYIFHNGVFYAHDIKRYLAPNKELFVYAHIHTVDETSARHKLVLSFTVLDNKIEQLKKKSTVNEKLNEFQEEIRKLSQKQVSDIKKHVVEYNKLLKKYYEILNEVKIRPTFIAIVDEKRFIISETLKEAYIKQKQDPKQQDAIEQVYKELENSVDVGPRPYTQEQAKQAEEQAQKLLENIKSHDWLDLIENHVYTGSSK